MKNPEMLGYVERAKEVLQRPKEFFKGLKSEDLNPSIIYYAIITFVSMLIASLLTGPAALVAAALAVVLGILVLLITTAIVNVAAGLMGGKGNFNLTTKVMIYAATATMAGNAFNIIPILGQLIALAGSLYGLYLSVIGLAEIHKLPAWKALVALLVPGLILGAILAAFAAIFAGLWAMIAGLVMAGA